MKQRQAAFGTREARMEYLAAVYRPYLQGRVLDVGCDRAVLKERVVGIDYLGIDIGGTPDLKINLEQTPSLPFGDNHFDCVVCIDVLEHLDNLHQIFLELVRVSRRYLVLSLPNCWNVARRPISRGYGQFLHYGLPYDPPPDRHKWFFNISEAEAFLRHHCRRQGLNLKEIHTTEKPRGSFIRGTRRLIYRDPARYLNRYAHTLWALIAKPSAKPSPASPSPAME
ncbi:MAG: methyltransferase domain-containing protein [Desulfobacterales bacterium]